MVQLYGLLFFLARFIFWNAPRLVLCEYWEQGLSIHVWRHLSRRSSQILASRASIWEQALLSDFKIFNGPVDCPDLHGSIDFVVPRGTKQLGVQSAGVEMLPPWLPSDLNTFSRVYAHYFKCNTCLLFLVLPKCQMKCFPHYYCL